MNEVERAIQPATPEDVNWNEILRLSFLFSQGHANAQKDIINWLAKGPLAGKAPKTEDFKEGIITAYVKNSPAHNDSRWDMKAEEEFRSTMVKEQEQPGRRSDNHTIALDMISCDREYLVERNGRPAEITRAGRDIWSSFVIDFGLLQKGTHPWSYESLPEAYKLMWKTVIEELPKHSVTASHAREVFGAYLENHTDLSSGDRTIIESYRQKLINAQYNDSSFS